jgi:hypothetical protein
MNLLLERYPSSKVQTLGTLHIVDENNASIYYASTLELPWKDNKNRISCIPIGTYPVIKHISPKFGECFWIQDVPGRSEILIHKGNFYTDILGCILPGADFTDINGDDYLDVVSSGDTMEELLMLLPDKFKITIINTDTGVLI